MTIKCSRTAAAPRTFTYITDAAARSLPNADWTMAAIVVLDGDLTVTEAQYFIATGGSGGAGAVGMMVNTGISTPEFNTFLNGGSSGICTINFTPVAGKAWLYALMRKDNVLTAKLCPILTTQPTDGSAVITTTKTQALSAAMNGPGIGVNSVQSLILGERAGDRRLDNSMTRAFRIDSALTDLEIAKLAWGMEITDLGKTPVWYLRMNDGSDTADRGPNAYNTARSTGATALPLGTAPGFGFVGQNAAPVITTAPAIDGTPKVGSSTSYKPGTVTGYPAPTIGQQWLLDGTAINGATGATYTPTASDAGKTLSVRQTASNSEGAATPVTSQGVVVVASSDAITVTAPAAERIFQRISGAAAVPLSGTWSNTKPASIEYQLYTSDGLTVAKAWADAGATINNDGTWTASPSIPQTPAKRRIAVRGKTSGGAVIAASDIHANRFGVGDLIGCIGSSSAATWFYEGSGASDDTVMSVYSSSAWGNFGKVNVAASMAASYAAKAGICVGMLNNGQGGSSLGEWIGDPTRWGWWPSFQTAVGNVGGKLAAVFCTVGSNDAGRGTIVSRAVHLANMRTLISMCRNLVADQNLPILWSGFNRRTDTNKSPEVYEFQANAVRMAENDLGDDPYVYHVQAIDYELNTADGIHLTSAGFQACGQRMSFVWNSVRVDGVYRRGPKVTSLTYAANQARIGVQHRNGTDIYPTSGITGVTVTDGDSSGVAPTITSIVREDSSHYLVTFNRALVAPVAIKYGSGGNPNMTTPAFDNGATALPMHVETDLVATASGSTSTFTADFPLSWAIYNGVQADFPLSWAIQGTGNFSADFPLSWEILAPAPVAFVPSKARTLKVSATSRAFAPVAGGWWNTANDKEPYGIKDPDSTIDISIDWSDWLADCQDTAASIRWILPEGMTKEGEGRDGGLGSVFLKGGQAGKQPVIAELATNSTPPRIDQRTVYLQIEER